MTIGPTHTYIYEGIRKGYSENQLSGIISRSSLQKANGISYLHSLNHISYITGAHYLFLRSVVDRTIFPYKQFTIPKKNGGVRNVSSPVKQLKIVQRWICTHILADNTPHWRCFSFHKKASILNCAREHSGAKWLIKIDIENFFDSIKETQVYSVFKSMGYNSLVSFELARLCTLPSEIATSDLINSNANQLPYKRQENFTAGRLPQGSPTSPMLSNLVFDSLDVTFQRLAEKKSFVYTRYADDICFSSCQRSLGREECLQIIKIVSRVLRSNNYQINRKKLKIIPPATTKSVLGLNVDWDTPKLSKKFKKRCQFHVRGITKFGLAEHAKYRRFESVYGMIKHVYGLINYCKEVEPSFGSSLEILLTTALEREGVS
ncbi:reverse transcriptase family protein [Vibrio splendidus]